MRFQKNIIASLLILIVMVSWSGCGKQENKKTNQKQDYTSLYQNCLGIVIDDSSELSEVLTTTYSLEELWTYFEDSTSYALQIDGYEIKQGKTIEEINRHFKIQVLRSGLYSVFKATEGGLFYVFFSPSVPRGSSEQRIEDLRVCHVSYIKNRQSDSCFDKLISMVLNKRPIAEIYNEDPYAYFSIFHGRGTISTHFLAENRLLEITYKSDLEREHSDFAESYLVAEKEKIGSVYSLILDKDYPF